MSDGTSVVDVDAHFTDQIEDLYDHLDEDDPWREKFELAARMDETPGTTSFFPTVTHNRSNYSLERSGFKTREDIREAMADLGVDKMLLIGQQMLRMGGMSGGDLRQIKYTDAYMEHLLTNIVAPEDGIYATIPLVHTDPQHAAEIVDRYGGEDGVVGAVVVSGGGEPPLGNTRYDPMYAACESHDLPVMFHADGEGLDDFYLEGFTSIIETHALGFLMTNMSQLTSIVIQGVPERFPDLDLVFLEAGLLYVPMMMCRLDQEYLQTPDDAPMLNKLPSKYMEEFYYGTQPLEQPPTQDYLRNAIEIIGGPEQLMWASDWPHPDYDETRTIEQLPFLSEEEKAKVLGGNAEAVFDI